MRKMMFAAAVAAAAVPAFAQTNDQGGLVTVNIQDVTILQDFLNDSQVAALNDVAVPVSVQVPVGVAANVCGVDANVIAQQKKGDSAYTCDATSGSQALAQNVIKQKLSQQK